MSERESPQSHTPQSQSIEILFEDDYFVAVNKPAGLSVHVNFDPNEPNLQSLIESQLGRRLVLFHRLDKETTGVVLLGKRKEVSAPITQAFEEKRIRKAYVAVVSGRWQREWSKVETWVERATDGSMRNVPESSTAKRAVTTFRVLAANDDKSWIEAIPKTGRTHQIRLHCLERGCPILGDKTYGLSGQGSFGQTSEGVVNMDEAMALHAHRLDFSHPITKMSLSLRAMPPKSFFHRLQGLPFEGTWKKLFEASSVQK